MLAQLIGQFDFSTALMMIAFFGCFGIPAIIAATRYKTTAERQLDVLREEHRMKEVQLQLQLDDSYRHKQLEQNLITSHRSKD